MSTHTLSVELDSIEQERLDAGEYVFPEHPDSRGWHIRCDSPQHCNGWLECTRQHICKHGHEIVHDELSIDGPCPGIDDDNCIASDEEEAEFHGEWHTYRWGWGWTVPFRGCVVAENWDGDLPHGIDSLPIGEHPVEEDWYDDTSVALDLVAA